MTLKLEQDLLNKRAVFTLTVNQLDVDKLSSLSLLVLQDFALPYQKISETLHALAFLARKVEEA